MSRVSLDWIELDWRKGIGVGLMAGWWNRCRRCADGFGLRDGCLILVTAPDCSADFRCAAIVLLGFHLQIRSLV